jgi:hypothetical protein
LRVNQINCPRLRSEEGACTFLGDGSVDTRCAGRVCVCVCVCICLAFFDRHEKCFPVCIAQPLTLEHVIYSTGVFGFSLHVGAAFSACVQYMCKASYYRFHRDVDHAVGMISLRSHWQV